MEDFYSSNVPPPAAHECGHNRPGPPYSDTNSGSASFFVHTLICVTFPRFMATRDERAKMARCSFSCFEALYHRCSVDSSLAETLGLPMTFKSRLIAALLELENPNRAVFGSALA